MTKATAKPKEEALPAPEEQEQLLAAARAFAANPRFAQTRQALQRLRQAPPQSLLLEGGASGDRLDAALYWATLLNCPQSDSQPCLSCPVCLRLISRLHRDLFFFDGREGSIKIDEVREMRAILGEPPREAQKRIVIFCEAQALGEAAANALLKSLEEPRPGTAFVLLAPQRERLLPTLVSRSWILTLPWPNAQTPEADAEANEDAPQLQEWTGALLDFARSGRGWMERTGRRGALDARLAGRLLLRCQTALVQSLSNTAAADPLAQAFAALSPQSRRVLDEALAEVQDSLNYQINPALLLDWLATRLFFLFARDGVK